MSNANDRNNICLNTDEKDERECVCVCISLNVHDLYVSVITHQVHSGGSVTQGHADPGGCVSDNLMIHPLQSDLILCFPSDGPDTNSVT